VTTSSDQKISPNEPESTVFEDATLVKESIAVSPPLKNEALWRPLYPFESHFMKVGGLDLHYIDEKPDDWDADWIDRLFSWFTGIRRGPFSFGD